MEASEGIVSYNEVSGSIEGIVAYNEVSGSESVKALWLTMR